MSAAEDGGAAQSQAGEQQAPEWRVLETFRIGEDIHTRSLAVDEQAGSLWVGTSRGVHEVDLASRELKQTLTREAGLANEYVFSIYVAGRNDIWFGTNGGGASRYQAGEWKTYFPMHGLADYWVFSFAQQADGTLWIGTWDGANQLRPQEGPGRAAMDTFKEELINEWVYGIAVDDRQQVWFATEEGISVYDGESWQAWTHEDGLGGPNTRDLPPSTNTGLGTRSRHDLSITAQGRPTYNPNYVFDLVVSAEDEIWAGTWGGGASRFDGERWHNLTRDDGLAGNIVYSLIQAPDGAMWFGTNRGISRYHQGQWQTFGREDGLFGNSIYALAAAPNGDVWAGMKGGVARLGR